MLEKASGSESMIESSIIIKSDLQSVFDAFYHLPHWVNVLHDVIDVDLQYDDGTHQVFTMTVVRPSGMETVRGIRIADKHVSITLCQTTPPPGFLKMHGYWYFTPAAEGVFVRAVRDVKWVEPEATGKREGNLRDCLTRNLITFKEHLENGH